MLSPNSTRQRRVPAACVAATALVFSFDASAGTTSWFAFADAAYQRGGALDRVDVLPTGIPPFARDELAPERRAWAGDAGVGYRISDRVYVVASMGTSTRLRTQYAANTKPIGLPATTTIRSLNQRDNATLMLGYKFFKARGLEAHVAAGVEYSKNNINSEIHSVFVLPSPVRYERTSSTKTGAVVEASVGHQITPSLSLSPYVRLFERNRSQIGLRLEVNF